MTIKEDKQLSGSLADDWDKQSANPEKQWIIVSVILIVAVLVAVILFVYKPDAEKLAVKEEAPFAEYVLVNYQSVAIPVYSQGSINAKTHIKLVAEVSGRVEQMAQLKLDGGFFKKGELLLSIDETDYRLAITKAKALVSSAEQQLARVEAEAGQAAYDLKQIGRDLSKSSSYALRKPHLAEARANLQAAKADLEIAQLQLKRTKVTAPFDGRVITKQVDIGQYVTPGILLAEIYSTEMVELRMPISLHQTKLLGLGLRNDEQDIEAIKVKLSTEYSSRKYEWVAKLSHTEGELDVRNRLVMAVAEISSPYAKDINNPDKPPLTPGMFVKAELSGLPKPAVALLPRAALRYGGEVWIINEENKLHKQKVSLYAKDRDVIYIKSGLSQGGRVIISAIDFPVNGMLVQPTEKQSTQNNTESPLKYKSQNE